jgi:hypothetical protein
MGMRGRTGVKRNGDKPGERVFRTKRREKEHVLMKPKSQPETVECEES